MRGMRSRVLLLVLVCAAIAALALSGLADPPPPPPTPAPEPAPPAPAPPPTRTSAVELRRGDNLVSALGRGGVGPRVGHEIAQALRQGGADLRRRSEGHTTELQSR